MKNPLKMKHNLTQFLINQSGSTAAEYVIIASLISIIIITVVAGIGESMNNMYYGPVQNALGR